MDVSPIITRLRTTLAGQGFVTIAGAADLDAAIEGAPATPAAYVLPLGEQAQPHDLAGQPHQRLAQAFGVVLVVSNVRDATGSAAATDLSVRRMAVRTALRGWVPVPANGEAVAYLGGRLLQFKDARLWWTDEFQVMTDA
jgi:hypothetical protein